MTTPVTLIMARHGTIIAATGSSFSVSVSSLLMESFMAKCPDVVTCTSVVCMLSGKDECVPLFPEVKTGDFDVEVTETEKLTQLD